MISAWSGERYGADDLRFGQILAGRIGLALDNAGLFSDLESIERRMDTVMSILDEAIVIHGADGELVFANPAAARMMGFDTHRGSAASAPPARSATASRSATRTAARSARATRSDAGRCAASPPSRRRCARPTATTGRERWTRTKAQAIKGPAGEVLYSVTAIEDVTEVKRAEFSHKLLARTGELLSHSGDYRATLEQVPRLLVPEFADWCSIEVPLEDGEFERVAIAHRDPERLRMIRDLRRRFPGQFADAGVSEALDERRGAAVRDDRRAPARARDQRRAPRGPARPRAQLDDLRADERRRADARRPRFRQPPRLAPFDETDVAIAIETARRAALAIENSRLAAERARVAEALQRELLPPNLPPMPGWEVATMYEPAGEVNEVGGDFYEVFRVEGGWALVLGDVAGRGAAAAALTAEARHTIRTAGALAAEPVAGLEVLNRNLRMRDDVALCSVAMLVLPDATGTRPEVLVYLAGHPHPMHHPRRRGRARRVARPAARCRRRPGWEAVAVALEVGDQLVLYTDGVIEARRPRGERFGSERLRQRLAGAASPELAVERVREGLADFGARAREDDAAVIAIRRGEPRDGQAATDSSPRRRADIEHLRRELSPVLRVQRSRGDLQDEVVAVELLEGDVGCAAVGTEIPSASWRSTSAGFVEASKRARISTRSGSRSGITASLRMTLAARPRTTAVNAPPTARCGRRARRREARRRSSRRLSAGG